MSFSCQYETRMKNIYIGGFHLRENKGIFHKQDVCIHCSVSCNTVQNYLSQGTQSHPSFLTHALREITGGFVVGGGIMV